MLHASACSLDCRKQKPEIVRKKVMQGKVKIATWIAMHSAIQIFETYVFALCQDVGGVPAATELENVSRAADADSRKGSRCTPSVSCLRSSIGK